MKISYLHIRNFKSIRDLEISDVENALILVGKNNTGKTAVIDAIRMVCGDYAVTKYDYLESDKSISVEMTVDFEEEDLLLYYSMGLVSKYKKYELWVKDFMAKLPSFQEGKITVYYTVNNEGYEKYSDGIKKNNPYIKSILPKLYHIDKDRNLDAIQNDVFQFYDHSIFFDLKNNVCMFDSTKKCNHCFTCIGIINQKKPEELNAYEATRLLEYKLLHTNINAFSEKLNQYFHANGSPTKDIHYEINFEPKDMLNVETKVYNKDRQTEGNIQMLSEGLKSIYALSLLEAYVEEEGTLPCVIVIEDPENYLHPQLQKVASEILFRLSKKNQVIFSTHSPNLIFNFSTKQIKQVVLDEAYYTVVKEDTDVDEILDDLGYTANDLMNVNFVFIVEGKQDKSRLPLLLEKYYSEVYDENGKPLRISIIATNSCTNIKTYANLKYMNQLYLKDQFLMIRDSDGKNPTHLKNQLCSYYEQRSKEDVGNLPRVTPRNVLILKYYSFENYFLDPAIMVKIGVIKSEDQFYDTLFKKYKDYLFKLGSTKRMVKNFGVRINTKQDIIDNMERIKIYVRGHNLYNIFYSKYRNDAETEILKKYIEAAPRDNFKDILDSIDSFVYFESRKKESL